jgi:nucleoside-diphosphate-sugar epimerase
MILVTGASGLVGSHLIYQLLTEGKKVRALIRSEQSKKQIYKIISYYTDQPDQLFSQIHWVFGDVTNKPSLEKAFEEITQVYHCAAFISFANKDLVYMKEVNIKGTTNVVNLCLELGTEKLVHVSSIAAVGKPESGKEITEEGEWPQGKMSPYTYTKTQSEMEVWRGIAEGLNAVIVNPSVILGPGNWHSGSGKIFSQVAKGMKFYTKGITGFVDVRDVARLMSMLMDSNISGRRFIVNAENWSYERLFKDIAKYLCLKAPSIYARPWITNMVWRLEALFSKMLGKPPTITKWSAKAAHTEQYYSGERLINELEYSYRPLEDTLSEYSHIFRIKP